MRPWKDYLSLVQMYREKGLYGRALFETKKALEFLSLEDTDRASLESGLEELELLQSKDLILRAQSMIKTGFASRAVGFLSRSLSQLNFESSRMMLQEELGYLGQEVSDFLSPDQKIDLINQEFSHSTALVLSGNLEQAQEGFERILELDSEQESALMSLGNILADRGFAEKAEARFQEGKALMGVLESEFSACLGDLYRQSNPDLALHHYKEALMLDPFSIDCLLRMSTIYVHKKAWDLATDTLEKALAVDSGDKTTWLKLGESFLNQGSIKNARDTWLELVERFPDSDEAEEARQFLKDYPLSAFQSKTNL